MLIDLHRSGQLKATLDRHRGPIFSLKWNQKGDLLLSGSVDRTAIVWDVATGTVKQQFEFHQGNIHFCVRVSVGLIFNN